MLKDVVIANKTYAKMNISDAGTLDDIAIKVIKQETPDFLLPIKMINIDGEIEIRYEIGEGTRLSYLPESMSKRELLLLLENMIRPFKTCNDWFLDYHNFYLDKDYIMIGKNYSSVRYVYIPDERYAQDDGGILNFFREFILNINLSDDPVYVMNLYRHLKEKDVSLVSMLDYIVQETMNHKNDPVAEKMTQRGEYRQKVNATATVSDNSVSENTKSKAKVETPVVNRREEPQNVAAQQEFGKADVKGDLINNLFGEVEEPKKEKAEKKTKEKKAAKESSKEKSTKGLFGGLFGGGKNNTDKVSQKPIQEAASQRNTVQAQPMPSSETKSYYEEEDVTFIGDIEVAVGDGTKLTLQLEEDRGYHFPQFIEIDLSRGHTTIGRFDKAGNAQSDYNFDASLSFISRRHFRIEKNGDQYRIIDLGSGNGTLVNDEPLVANMPYIIKAGDRIILSKNHRIVYRVC